MSASLPLVEGKNVEEISPTEPIETLEKVDETVELIKIPNVESQKEDTTSASSSKESINEDERSSDQVEEENIPSTSQRPIEEVDSKRSTKRAKSSAKPPSSRPLLKRRSSRIRIPIVSRSRRNVTEETDSATPRTSNKRSTKKRRIALFLESDYPIKKK